MHDILNREIKLGSWVITPGKTTRINLIIGKIIGIGSKMIRISALDGRIYHRYPIDVLIIDDIKELSLFLLTKTGNN